MNVVSVRLVPLLCLLNVVPLLAAEAGRLAPALPPRDRCQYIFVNFAPSSGPGRWHQSLPERFNVESLRKMIEEVGSRGTPELRLGVCFMFSILEREQATTAESIRRLLASCREADVPVLIGLDGQNWWETRSDLWNWWDRSLPGFSLANRMNVEWTGWGPEHAVKVGWRNWGQQFRLRPAPNLASPRVLAEHFKAYDLLIPIILDWARRLPPEKQYLFGGVKLGWEASINVNAYYRKDAEKLLAESPNDGSHDPTDHDPALGWTFGQPALGYAAVWTSGIRKSGELTREDVEKVVQLYLDRICRAAVQRGLPRDRLFNHQGGTYEPWDQHMSFRAALNDYSIPGWSFYSHDPPDCGPLPEVLKAAGRDEWAAAEWWRGGATAQECAGHYLAALRFKQCRFVAVFNWESIQQEPTALGGLRLALQTRSGTSRPASEAADDRP